MSDFKGDVMRQRVNPPGCTWVQIETQKGDDVVIIYDKSVDCGSTSCPTSDASG